MHFSRYIIPTLICGISVCGYASVFADDEDTQANFQTAQPYINTIHTVNPNLPSNVPEQKGTVGEILTRLFIKSGPDQGKIANWFLRIMGSTSDDRVLRWSGGPDGKFEVGSIYDDGTNIGIGGPVNPARRLNVTGDINLTGNLYRNGALQNFSGKFVDGTNTSDAVYTAGNVGIGTTNPTTGLKLDVEGKIGATEYCDAAGANCFTSNQVSVTGQIGGSGTPNALAKFTNSGEDIGNSIIFDNGTNVGIGTTNPRGKLETTGSGTVAIFSNINEQGSDTGVKIISARNADSSGETSYLDLANYDNNEGTGTEFTFGRIAGGMADHDGQTGFLHFLTNNGTSLIEAMRIAKDGNIGIGTTNPTSKLQLSDSGSVDLLISADSDNVNESEQPSLTLSQDGGAVIGKLGFFGSTNDLSLNNQFSASLKLGTNNTDRMIITDVGNVGIGFSAPTEKLQVGGNIVSSEIVRANGGFNVDGITMIGGDAWIEGDRIRQDSIDASKLAVNSVGDSEMIDNPSVDTIYANNWFRSNGNSGWYNETYQGGIYMIDNTWVRAYNGKAFYTTNVMRADNGFQVDNITMIGGDAWIEGDRIRQNSVDASELAPNSVGDSELIDAPTVSKIISTANGDGETILEYDGGHPLIKQISARGAIQIGSSDDAIYIGNGDVAHEFNSSHVNSAGEDIFIASDSSIYFMTDLQEGWGTQRTMVYNNTGDLSVPGSLSLGGTLNGDSITDNTIDASELAPNSVGDSEMIDNPTFGNITSTGIMYVDSIRRHNNSSGNLHLDAGTVSGQNNRIYLNYFSGDGVNFGNGSQSVVANINSSGDADFRHTRSHLYYDADNGAYYANPASESRFNDLRINGALTRANHNVGHLEGSYNNVGANNSQSNPIYTIGSSYNPSTTTLGNMYGIGYTVGSSASFVTGNANGWGMYIAADGDARTFLSATGGGRSYINKDGGDIGVGTDTPGSLFHLNGAATHMSLTSSDTSSSLIYLQTKGRSGVFERSGDKGWRMVGFGNSITTGYNQENDFSLNFWNGSSVTRGLDIDSVTGNIGVNNTAPIYKLDVAGNVRATNGFASGSDRRLKKNIKTSSGLDIITNLRGVSFDWKEDDKNDFGVIAQEIEEIIPEIVTTDPNTGIKAVQYNGLIAPLIEAVKEQQQQIEELKKEVQTLKNK